MTSAPGPVDHQPDDVRTFEIPATLDLKATVRTAKNPLMVGPTELWWSTRTPNGLATLHLQRTDPERVEASAWGEGHRWILDQGPAILGQRDDLEGFRPPSQLAEKWQRAPFKLARTDRPWDALVAGVFGQKVQVENAVRSRRQLARTHGDPAPGPRQGWILPGPETVAQMAYHQFHQLGVERKRADILIRVAREMRRMPNLTAKTPTQVRARLQAIRGIGPWTAAMVTATSMGDADAVPVGDFHIPNTISWHLAREERGTDDRMLELLEPYVGHRWRVILLAKGSGSAPKRGPRLSLKGDGLHLGR